MGLHIFVPHVEQIGLDLGMLCLLVKSYHTSQLLKGSPANPTGFWQPDCHPTIPLIWAYTVTLLTEVSTLIKGYNTN